MTFNDKSTMEPHKIGESSSKAEATTKHVGDEGACKQFGISECFAA